MTVQSAPPQMSPDGQWWWDGSQWLPAHAGSGQPSAAVATVLPDKADGGGIQLSSTQAGDDVRTDRLPIASFALGLLWLGGLGSVAAVVLGHLTRARSKHRGGRPRDLGLVGLTLGYVGIAASLILLTFGVPSFSQAQTAQQGIAVNEALYKAAFAQSQYLDQHGTYAGGSVGLYALAVEGYARNSNVTIDIVSASDDDFCMSGQYDGGDVTYYVRAPVNITLTPCR
jgi:hypothetical protein